jgi:hypothetical protein
MDNRNRTLLEELFMAVLSDTLFKDIMAEKFLDHTELLLKTIDNDEYSLIRYSV